MHVRPLPTKEMDMILELTDSMVDKDWFVEEFKGKHLSAACSHLLVTGVTEIICKTETTTLHMRRGGNEYYKIPGVVQLASNLMQAAASIVGNGMQVAEDELERLAICQSCPQLIKDRCSVCGCYVSMKVHFAASHCPKEKW